MQHLTVTDKINLVKRYINSTKDDSVFVSFDEAESVLTTKNPIDRKMLTNKMKDGKTIWFEKKVGKSWFERKTHILFHFCPNDGWYVDPQILSSKQIN